MYHGSASVGLSAKWHDIPKSVEQFKQGARTWQTTDDGKCAAAGKLVCSKAISPNKTTENGAAEPMDVWLFTVRRHRDNNDGRGRRCSTSEKQEIPRCTLHLRHTVSAGSYHVYSGRLVGLYSIRWCTDKTAGTTKPLHSDIGLSLENKVKDRVKVRVRN